MARVTRATVESSTLGVGALLALALVAMLNYFGWKYYQRFDWTADELYSLSEKSENIARGLDRPVEAVIFLSPGEPLFEPVRELLSRYAASSTNFSFRTVDPEKNLVEAQSLVDRYGLSHLDVVVLEAGEDRRVIETADLAEYDYSGLQAGRAPELTAFKGEQVFTGALLELIEQSKPRVLFTIGHGERSLDDNSPQGLGLLRSFLGEDNFDLEEWASLGQTEVPPDTDVIVVAGPTRGFAPPESALLSRFVAEGGRLFLLVDPVLGGSAGAVEPTGLEGLLADYGVALGQDIVIDPAGAIAFFGAETFFVDSYGDHVVTRPLRQAEIPVIVPLAQSLEVLGDAAEIGVTVLLETSSEGWGERDLDRLDSVEKGDGDLAGPVTVGLVVEQESEVGRDDASAEDQAKSNQSSLSESAASDTTRLAVFGDTDFATNSQLRNGGNAELVVNTINWLVERENLLAIPAKSPEQVRLNLSGSDLRTIGLVIFLVLPGLAILAGFSVFSRRRR